MMAAVTLFLKMKGRKTIQGHAVIPVHRQTLPVESFAA